MALQKITFDGASVSAKVDADLYHFLLSNQVGIIKGFKNEVGHTISSNTITFKDGYVSVYGRLVYVESNTQIKVTLDSSKKGFVVLGINTSTNNATLYLKEQAGSYPNLTTTNLLNNDGLYELVLCAYNKTATSISVDNSYQKRYIRSYMYEVDNLRDEIEAEGEPMQINPTKVSSGVYTVGNLNSYILTRSIISVQLTSAVVTFPGALLFITVGSSGSVNYRHTGADYTLGLSYQNGTLTISCGSTSHQIHRVYFYKR